VILSIGSSPTFNTLAELTLPSLFHVKLNMFFIIVKFILIKYAIQK